MKTIQQKLADKYIIIGDYVVGYLTEKYSGMPIHKMKHPRNVNYSSPKTILNLTHIFGNCIYKINYKIKK